MTSISSASPYRVLGPVISIAELAKTRPGMVIPATQAEIAEEKLYHEQFQARLDAIGHYTEQHPDKVYAQVIVDSKVVATVYESGSANTRDRISRLTENGSGLDLAKKRLEDILREVKGKVIYSDFLPSPGWRRGGDTGLGLCDLPEGDGAFADAAGAPGE
ncbi:MAG: hypothetical protein H7Z39_07525 [Burkholderiaceae bacterium]|nr:hypothetical protein [Burkholderiaceae bacterium]